MNTLIKTFAVKTLVCSFYFVCLFFGALHAATAIHKGNLSPLNASEELIWQDFEKYESDDSPLEEDCPQPKAREVTDWESTCKRIDVLALNEQLMSASIFELIVSNHSLKIIEHKLDTLKREDFSNYEYTQDKDDLPNLENDDSPNDDDSPNLEEGDSILHAAIRCERKDREAIVKLILRKAQEKGVDLEQLFHNPNENGETPLDLAQSIDPKKLLPLLQLPPLQSYTTSSSSSSLFTTSSSSHHSSSSSNLQSSSVSVLDSFSSSHSQFSSTLSPCSPYSCEYPSIQNLEKALQEKNPALVQKILREAPDLAKESINDNFNTTTLLRLAALIERNENDKPLQYILLSNGANPWDSSASDVSDSGTKKLIVEFQEKTKASMHQKACAIIRNKNRTNKKEQLEKLCQQIEKTYGEKILNSFINYQRPTTGTTLLHILEEEGEMELYIYLIGKGANPSIKNKESLTPINLTHTLSPSQQLNILAAAINAGCLYLVEAIFFHYPKILKNHRTYNTLISDASMNFLSTSTLNRHSYKNIITSIIKNENGCYFLLKHNDMNFLHLMFTRLSQLLIHSHTHLDRETQLLLKHIFAILKQSELPKLIQQKLIEQSPRTGFPSSLISMIMELIGDDHCYYNMRLGSVFNSPSRHFKNKTPLDLLPPTYTFTKLQLESEGFIASSSSSHTTSFSTFLNSSSGSNSSSSSSSNCAVQ